MRHPSIATLLAFALTSASALAQVAPNPTQHSTASPQEPVTLFRITVVGRTRPRSTTALGMTTRRSTSKGRRCCRKRKDAPR